MAEAAKDQDQSMEDILQSIKRIIAEEGDPVAGAGSDVLELTERLAEDGSVTRITPQEDEPKVDSISLEEFIDAPVMAPEPIAAPAAPAPQAAMARVPEPEPAAAALRADEDLMSNSTLSASVAALNSLRDSMGAQPAPRPQAVAFRSGSTVEDLVLEGLKPMLKEWLDANLPGLVEALVKKEISKLSGR